jgi:dCMP deaminase
VNRPHWRTYFMRLAYLAATRATCDRKQVGAVVVTEDHRVVATGYNGAPKGMPSCDQVGHMLVDNHCVASLHAESNALDFAGRFALGCSIYVTASPCFDCAKRIINAGIVRVTYDEAYESRYGKSDEVPEYLAKAGVMILKTDPGEMEGFRRFVGALDGNGIPG